MVRINIGVTALINPVINVIIIIPKHNKPEIKVQRILLKIPKASYHETDSENIINPLKNPKCSVSNPEIKSLPFVIPKWRIRRLGYNQHKEHQSS